MDTEDLLRLLNAHCVEYVIIGATAFPVHGYSRTTLDIDLFTLIAGRQLNVIGEREGLVITEISVLVARQALQ